MKKFLISALGILLSFGNVFATTTPTTQNLSYLNRQSVEELLRIKASMDTVLGLQKEGALDTKATQAKLEEYLKQASQVAGQKVTLETLAQEDEALRQSLESQRLTVLQRAAGFINGTNILLTFGAILIAYCLSFLAPLWFKFFRLIFSMIPYEVYEAGMYVGSVVLMAANQWCHNGLEQYFALIGALLLAGAIIVTKIIHEIKTDDPVRYFGTLFLVWAPVAYFTCNPFVGFLAVAALMSLLGFSVWLFPLCYCIGFKDEEAVGRGTTAAFFVLAAFVYMKITGVTNPGIKVFEEGALFLGSFVGYLGLLIASSKWYDRGNHSRYFWMQFVTMVAGVLAIFVGSTFGIGELTKIGGTFFVLWNLEKIGEIMPTDRKAFAYVGLFVGALIFAFGWFVKTHAALVGPFLLFM